MGLYYIGIFGTADTHVVGQLTETLREILEPLKINDQLVVVTQDKNFDPPNDFSSVAIYFGSTNKSTNDSSLRELMRRGVPFIPVVTDLKKFSGLVPECLLHVNGLELNPTDAKYERLASAVLASLGLLPRQRRIFLSYRRDESRLAALQLFEELSARHFDVFLDTHDVPPGDDFQEVLYHRLSDSDVLVMLDTQDYFGSRWTTIEFGKAMAKSLAIVRLGWPGVAPDSRVLSAESIQFTPTSFSGQILTQSAVAEAAIAIERARSRCIAIRSSEMVSTLVHAASKVGGTFLGLGPQRTAVLGLHDNHRLLVFPSIGVPTSEHLFQVANLQSHADSRAVVYDDCGIARSWQAHLEWLGKEVRSARWLTLGQAKWQLSTWASELPQ